MSSEIRSPASAGAAARRSAHRRSIELMVGGMACFVANDALVKVVSESMPTGQLVFLRGVMATAFILLVIRLTRTRLEPRRLARGWVLGRAALDALGSITYLIALFHLPIANATAVNMAAPLAVTLLAAWLLHERVGLQRWMATLAGFAGVLLVIQPGASGFNAYAWLSLLGTLLIALRDTVVRFVPPDMPTLGVTLVSAIVVTLAAGLMSAVEGWGPVDARSIAMLAAAAALLSTAYGMVVLASRSGELSVVAPFRYTALPFAALLGWVAWGHVPNALAWAGMALVIGAGLYVLRHPRP